MSGGRGVTLIIGIVIAYVIRSSTDRVLAALYTNGVCEPIGRRVAIRRKPIKKTSGRGI